MRQGLLPKAVKMFQILGVPNVEKRPIIGPESKRRHSFDDNLTSSFKRPKTVDLVPDNLVWNTTPQESQPEVQQDSITESPSSFSCGEEASFTSNTSLTTLSRCSSSTSTHDVSRTNFHIKDLANFAITLEEAAKGAFPNRGRSRYSRINVCLIRWAEDQSVEAELERLRDVLEQGYGFKVETWTIPTINSHRKLMGKALDFIEDFDASDNLFVVYYAGHGTINENRQSVWCCTQDPKYASVDWSSIQSLFDDAVSDVLILLDCCAAASSINTSGNGVNETIAACGFEGIAPPPGPHSFTNALVEVLDDWKRRVHFSVSLLHSEILFQLKRKRPEKGREGTRIPGWCSTPVHFISSSDPRPQSIELSRLRVLDKKTGIDLPPSPPLPQSTLLDDQATTLTSIFPCGELVVPHVLISVALEEDQADLNLESCRLWLTRFPALVKYANVQGVFKSHSTLLLLSLPVAIWNMLPENKACFFISFITSENLACTTPTTDVKIMSQATSKPSLVKSPTTVTSPRPFFQPLQSNNGTWDAGSVPDELCATSKPISLSHSTYHTVPTKTEHSEGFRYSTSPSDSNYGTRQNIQNVYPLQNSPKTDQSHFGNITNTADHRLFQNDAPLWHPPSNFLYSETITNIPPEIQYRCHVPGCKSKGKSWPRLDSFRNHLKRVHHNQLHTDAAFEEMTKHGGFGEMSPAGLDATSTFDRNSYSQQTTNYVRKSSNTMQSDISHSPQVKLESIASENKKGQVVCEECKKFKGRPCELKKHMKRHIRPYACTFPDCDMRFGSKGDWKRHENSRHFHLETWRCSLPHNSSTLNNPFLAASTPTTEIQACAKVYYGHLSFLEHLKKSHADFSKTADETEIRKKVDECLIERNWQTRFWCGFCTKLVDLKKTSLEAWTERFDHIEDHFMGRHGFLQQSIGDWIPLDSGGMKREIESPRSSVLTDDRTRSQSYFSLESSDPGSRLQSPHSLGSPRQVPCFG